MSASKARSRGIQGRRWVTLTDIAAELRVRPDRIRELGILEGCRRLPAGSIGRHELWLWPDVERSALEAVSQSATTGTTARSAKAGRRVLTRPSDAFERVVDGQ